MRGRQYTWSPGETLPQLLARRGEIMKKHAEGKKRAKAKRANLPLVEVLSEALDEDEESTPCTMCHL